MNSIEEQLTDAFRRRDAGLVVRDELDAILDDDHIVRFSGRQNTAARRRPLLLAVAAAALIAVGAGGLIWAQRPEPATPATSDEPQTSLPEPATTPPFAPASSEPTAFPTLDVVPDGLTVSAFIEQVPAAENLTEALVGRTLDDGTIDDTVVITVKATPFEIGAPLADPPEVQVLGQPATVYDDSSVTTHPALVRVAWGSGPYFLASGPAPLDFLAAATTETFQVPDQTRTDEPPDLTFGALPGGYDVIAEPAPFGEAFTGATLSVGLDNFDVSVSTRNPVLGMSEYGPLRSVTIGDRPGWAFQPTSSEDIAWKVDDSTYAYLKVNVTTDANAVLDLVNNIEFVDLSTWTARYQPAINAPVSTEGESTNSAPSVEAFCVEYASLQGERPESYVGSPEHVAATERLLSVAPQPVTNDVATFLDYLRSGAIDSRADPETNLTENWPDEVQNAIASTQIFAADNC